MSDEPDRPSGEIIAALLLVAVAALLAYVTYLAFRSG